MPSEPEKKQSLSVQEYLLAINGLLKQKPARVLGEVSAIKHATSGHVYFTIKDSSGEGVLDCVLFAYAYKMSGVALDVGIEVIVSGAGNIYAPLGKFSFVAQTVELVGEGALKKEYEALKKKLQLEGLFDQSCKRVVPPFPKRIGVITSLKGAVIHDFVNNIGPYGFSVFVCDARVEGKEAIGDLVGALKAIEAQHVDVIVLMRGGGSLESLQAFNNEMLVRAIRSSRVPVVAAIGHHEDVPLVALTADIMVSTPTAAAQAVSASYNAAELRLEQLSRVVSNFSRTIVQARHDLEQYARNCFDAYEDALNAFSQRMALAQQAITLNDPRLALHKGYSIVRHAGAIVKSVAKAKIDDSLLITFFDGTIDADIKSIHHDKTK